MRRLAAVLLFACCVCARAETIVLNDGKTVAGSLVSSGEMTVRVNTGGQTIDIARSQIKSIEPDRYLFTLSDGSSVSGVIKDIDEQSFRVGTASGERLLPRSLVVSVSSFMPVAAAPAEQSVSSQTVTALSTAAPSAVVCSTCVAQSSFTVVPAVAAQTPVMQPAAPAQVAVSQPAAQEPSPQNEPAAETTTAAPVSAAAAKKMFSVQLGAWQAPLKLDLTAHGGPNDAGIGSAGVAYGAKYMFRKFGMWLGAELNFYSIASKTQSFASSDVKTSGEVVSLSVSGLYDLPSAKWYHPYFSGGAGVSSTKVNYNVTDNATQETKGYSVSAQQPVLYAGAGLEGAVRDAIVGAELRCNYISQSESMLSNSRPLFISLLLRMTWKFR